MRILQLAPRFPFPPDDGGKIGIANITKEFSKHADVTFFAFDDGNLSEETKELIRPYAEPVIYNHSTNNSPARILNSIFRQESLYFSKHSSAEILSFLDELTEKGEFDVIHADHSCMAPLALYLKRKYNIPVGLRLHNIEWIIWQRYADVLPKSHPKAVYIKSQAKKLRRDEAEVLSLIDTAFAITEEDKQRALELCPGLYAVVATAGVDIDEWTPDRSIERNREQLILATTYHWQHNIDAVKWFIENVQTKLHAANPNIELTLIGKNIPEWINRYKDIGVNPVGYVDKVQPWLNRAGIYIAPLFVGGGIRIKILEALAMGLPVLATPVAAEGIRSESNNGLFICKTADDYIRLINKMIDDNDFRKTAAQNSSTFIKENYTWEKNVGMMLDKYKLLSEKY